MEKRKPGRPAKIKPAVHMKRPSIAEVRKELEKAQAFNNVILQAQIEHEQMHAKVVNSLNTELDEAYKQHEYMLSVAYTQLNYAQEHLANIEYHAGSMTIEDVAASINVIKRILHNKFGYKPQMVEM
jgi:hypothetical protein